jgi:preprotein translocase subunit SecY
MFNLHSKNIFWKAFSPFIIKLYGGQCGDQYEERAAISSHIHRLIANGADELSAVHKAFSSRDLPDMASVLATCIFLLLVLNLQGFRIVLPLRSHEEPTLQINYTIRLSYLSFAPLLFQDALVLTLYLIPQVSFALFWLTLCGPILAYLVAFAIAPNVRNGANPLECELGVPKIFETWQVNRC